VIVWQLDLQLPMQAVPITTTIVMQHYVIKFVIDGKAQTVSLALLTSSTSLLSVSKSFFLNSKDSSYL
jgi:hypothetical protein